MSEYKREWRFLALAVLFSFGSLFFDLQSSVENSEHWFMRSGAIVVLIAAYVEYRTSNHILKDIQRIARINKGKDAVIDFAVEDQPLLNTALKALTELPPQPSKERQLISRCTHILMLAGTLVWGYADLII